MISLLRKALLRTAMFQGEAQGFLLPRFHTLRVVKIQKGNILIMYVAFLVLVALLLILKELRKLNK